MSVFTFDTKSDNPVTYKELDSTCAQLGVTIPEDEKEAYRTLLAVYHEAAESLLSIPGASEIKPVDAARCAFTGMA
jgi:amidase